MHSHPGDPTLKSKILAAFEPSVCHKINHSRHIPPAMRNRTSVSSKLWFYGRKVSVLDVRLFRQRPLGLIKHSSPHTRCLPWGESTSHTPAATCKKPLFVTLEFIWHGAEWQTSSAAHVGIGIQRLVPAMREIIHFISCCDVQRSKCTEQSFHSEVQKPM